MRYALLSDIHANLPALEAVLEDASGRTHPDATYHLGDLVGYGPWPNQVAATLRPGGPARAGRGRMIDPVFERRRYRFLETSCR
jgi:hypothetical protein